MSWVAAAGRIFVITALSAGLGFLYGYPLEAVVLVLLALVGWWLYQMQRVQLWLNEPTAVPPDVHGIWGELLARIYTHQRKHTETQQRLQSIVEYLQNSFASMRDGVVMVDEQGVIKWMNEAAGPLLGLHYPQDTGQTLGNLVRSPEFSDYFLRGDYNTPLEYTAGGAKTLHLQVEITLFGDSERLLFVRDVSARVRMEQVRSDFVANVSHELRTPLTVISGYLGTFLENPGEMPECYTKPLQQMDQQAQRMEHLLKDLLWLSRVESETRDTPHELLDVGVMLHELQEEMVGLHPGTPIELDLETDQKIQGDYREWYSAVSNLVTNACKYSPEGTPVIIGWRVRGDRCLLSVRDQGIGIDSVHIPRLTERFYRVDDSRNSATGGTGLGLAIVKHVAAAHGGLLQIESQLGKGSMFTLEIPIRG